MLYGLARHTGQNRALVYRAYNFSEFELGIRGIKLATMLNYTSRMLCHRLTHLVDSPGDKGDIGQFTAVIDANLRFDQGFELCIHG